MGTRGAVAWGNLDKWTGIYNHLDSYPRVLGKDVWNRLKTQGPSAVVSMIQKGREWNDALRGGLCPYCGQTATPGSTSLLVTHFDNIFDYKEKGIEGIPEWQREGFLLHTDAERWIAHQKKTRGELWDKSIKKMGAFGEYDSGYKSETESGLLVIQNFTQTGFPDPGVLFHSHAEGGIKASRMTEKTSDKLFIEWVYIIDEEAQMLHVLTFGQVGQVREGLRMIGPKKKLAKEIANKPGDAYAHWHVASVPFTAEQLPEIQNAYPEEN